MTLNELEAIFRPFGQIITSRILSDNITGLSKGVGFVRFDKKEEAELAIQSLNGTVPAGCVDQITVKFANNPATNTAKSVLQELEAVQQVAASNLMPLTLLSAAAPLRSAIGPIHHAPLAAKYRYSPLAAALPGAAAPAVTAQATADYLTTMLQMSQMNALADILDTHLEKFAFSLIHRVAEAAAVKAAAESGTSVHTWSQDDCANYRNMRKRFCERQPV
ncbi:hypothetical protein OESDEN_01331 [Oesophagostomum dentatum]|uniref:RRM domain-containing protein n=1 Tax=Oesophagostomum dentatum TaxID=61180 RepID=A0A0B1TN81_OESDE|nr:hypothetical protein OESDEN_01331 [Oesophagostomum dentatum]